MNSQSRRWIGWLAVPVFVLACSSSSDDTGAGSGGSGGGSNAAQSVGPAGATLVQNGVTLSIPANSVAADTAITVSVAAAPAGYTLASQAYQFGPAGTVFLTPITVTIPLSSAAPGAHLFWSNASGGFDDVGGTVNGLTLTGQVTHFSIGFCAIPVKDGGAPPPIDASSTGQGGAGGSLGLGNGGQGGVTSSGGSSGNGGTDASTQADGSNATVDASPAADGSTAPADASTGADSSTGSADASIGADSSTGSTDASVAADGPADAAAIDAAALCAPYGLNLPFAQVGTLDSAAPPDASTYTGGAITSAKYHLAGVTHYGAGQYSGTRQANFTIDTTAKTIQMATFGGFIGMTYTNVDAKTIQATVVCNTSDAAVSSFTWYYTATVSNLTLTEVGSSDVSVYATP